MKKARESDEAVLADRLVNYSDALVAVAFLAVSGFGLAVADPDIRCTIARATTPIILANVLNAFVITALILLLRRWENDLRSAAPQTGKVARYGRWLHHARIAIVWISLVLSITMAAASRTDTCEEASPPDRLGPAQGAID